MRILGWLIATIAAVGLLAMASRVSIPIAPVSPVPVTLQSLAVTLAGALLGWRHGAIVVTLWLVCGAAGLPVLAGGSSGLAQFQGPSAGYLVAFPFAAAATGGLMERGWSRSWPMAIGAMAVGTALCLAGGWAWLTWQSGMARAWATGVVPFLIGAAVKAVLGGLVMRWLAANGFKTPRGLW